MIELWLVVSTMCFMVPVDKYLYYKNQLDLRPGPHYGQVPDYETQCKEIVQLSTSAPAQGVRAYQIFAIDENFIANRPKVEVQDIEPRPQRRTIRWIPPDWNKDRNSKVKVQDMNCRLQRRLLLE